MPQVGSPLKDVDGIFKDNLTNSTNLNLKEYIIGENSRAAKKNKNNLLARTDLTQDSIMSSEPYQALKGKKLTAKKHNNSHS